ncbi:IS1 family transposase [Hansschlegelia sp. KR7-227]|uniref:IS1 family transposase n=1 Tax=Hansschlegelia sp. KR7-227 TaxID=3400914 RepID=UPI003C0F3758
MNKLSSADRARILHLLCEGTSIRAITRLTGASKNTVAKLLVDAGKACAAYHDEHVRGLTSKRIQVDEIWSFIYAKQKNVAAATAAPEAAGDVWTWTAIDADTKLIASYLVGGRDSEYAMWFMDDLALRLANRVQLTSDGHKAYLDAVEGAFGAVVDYAMLLKLYGTAPEAAKGRYSPADCIGTRKIRIEGSPDKAHVSTSYAERANLTMRMHMRRFTRLTNAFSKKVENYAYAVALHIMYYNFVRIHRSLKVTPAMAASVSDRLWEIGDIVKLVGRRMLSRRGVGRTRSGSNYREGASPYQTRREMGVRLWLTTRPQSYWPVISSLRTIS